MPIRPFTSRVIASLVLLAAGCASSHSNAARDSDSHEQVYGRPIKQAIREGVAYLIADQNPDGSWGTGLVSHGDEIDISVPGSHEAFRTAVTALCVMALRQAGEHKAHDRGVEYLLTHFKVYRATPDLIYNIWAHCYIVQALSLESHTNHDPRVRDAVEFNLGRMLAYESFSGGWNYYDFNAGAQVPAGGATSFGTAAALVALQDAKNAGFTIDPQLINPSVHRLQLMRLPNGAVLYGADYKYMQTLPADMPRGSMGRALGVYYALKLWDTTHINDKACIAGLNLFFDQHAALDMGRKAEWPHEMWYQTSGYYYYFDHYYGSLLINSLGSEARKEFAKRLTNFVLPYQEPDGSWWDYIMWDYHKPYGTAFAIMTLMNCEGK
jgi:hypothetical protein